MSRPKLSITTACVVLAITFSASELFASAISNNRYINTWAQGGPAKVKQKKRLEQRKLKKVNKERVLKENLVHDKFNKQEALILRRNKNHMLPAAILEALDDKSMTQEEVFFRAKQFIKNADDHKDPKGYRRAGILLEVLEASPPSEGYSYAQVHEYLGYCIMKEAKDERGFILAKKLAEAAVAAGENETWLLRMLWQLNDKLFQLTHEYEYQEGMDKYKNYATS